MKTRDRILAAGLELFNTTGEPNVSTNHIADEIEISPGNLYYHFRNKEQIVEELFASFLSRIGDLLDLPDRPVDLEEIWLYWHFTFEIIGDYRFLYRDLVDILARYRKLKLRFSRLLQRQLDNNRRFLRDLHEQKLLAVDPDGLGDVAVNMTLVATFWLNFESVLGKESASTAPAVMLLLSVLAAYLEPEAQAHIRALAAQYG